MYFLWRFLLSVVLRVGCLDQQHEHLLVTPLEGKLSPSPTSCTGNAGVGLPVCVLTSPPGGIFTFVRNLRTVAIGKTGSNFIHLGFAINFALVFNVPLLALLEHHSLRTVENDLNSSLFNHYHYPRHHTKNEASRAFLYFTSMKPVQKRVWVPAKARNELFHFRKKEKWIECFSFWFVEGRSSFIS